MKYRNILIPILVLSTTFACNKKENGSGLETGQNNSDTFNSRLKQINQVAGIGKIEPETKILSLASERGGIIKEIFKSNGDKVKPGETIITLDSDEEQSNMELLKARIKTQENQIKLDRYSVKEAELKLDNKKRLLESARKLLKNGAETSQNIDDRENPRDLPIPVRHTSSPFLSSTYRTKGVPASRPAPCVMTRIFASLFTTCL